MKTVGQKPPTLSVSPVKEVLQSNVGCFDRGSKKMSNAERTKFLNDFSEYLGKKSAEILG